jgi:hypothetical protein
MVELRDAERDRQLGTITEHQLKFLIDALEEESSSDNDYYISADTIEMLETGGADATSSGSYGERSASAKASTFAGRAPNVTCPRRRSPASTCTIHSGGKRRRRYVPSSTICERADDSGVT